MWSPCHVSQCYISRYLHCMGSNCFNHILQDYFTSLPAIILLSIFQRRTLNVMGEWVTLTITQSLQSKAQMCILYICWCIKLIITPLPVGQNGLHATDDIFKYAFENEKFCVLTIISPEFVPQGPMDNKLSLFQVMAWHRVGDKSLHEAMLTH